MVLGKLPGGFALGTRAGANRRQLARFLSSPRVTVLVVGPKTAEHYADVYAQLRRKGRPIPSNDMWMAASAQEHGLALFTRDVHFQEIEGMLTVSSPDDLLP